MSSEISCATSPQLEGPATITDTRPNTNPQCPVKVEKRVFSPYKRLPLHSGDPVSPAITSNDERSGANASGSGDANTSVNNQVSEPSSPTSDIPSPPITSLAAASLDSATEKKRKRIPSTVTEGAVTEGAATESDTAQKTGANTSETEPETEPETVKSNKTSGGDVSMSDVDTEPSSEPNSDTLEDKSNRARDTNSEPKTKPAADSKVSKKVFKSNSRPAEAEEMPLDLTQDEPTDGDRWAITQEMSRKLASWGPASCKPAPKRPANRAKPAHNAHPSPDVFAEYIDKMLLQQQRVYQSRLKEFAQEVRERDEAHMYLLRALLAQKTANAEPAAPAPPAPCPMANNQSTLVYQQLLALLASSSQLPGNPAPAQPAVPPVSQLEMLGANASMMSPEFQALFAQLCRPATSNAPANPLAGCLFNQSGNPFGASAPAFPRNANPAAPAAPDLSYFDAFKALKAQSEAQSQHNPGSGPPTATSYNSKPLSHLAIPKTRAHPPPQSQPGTKPRPPFTSSISRPIVKEPKFVSDSNFPKRQKYEPMSPKRKSSSGDSSPVNNGYTEPASGQRHSILRGEMSNKLYKPSSNDLVANGGVSKRTQAAAYSNKISGRRNFEDLQHCLKNRLSNMSRQTAQQTDSYQEKVDVPPPVKPITRECSEDEEYDESE